MQARHRPQCLRRLALTEWRGLRHPVSTLEEQECAGRRLRLLARFVTRRLVHGRASQHQVEAIFTRCQAWKSDAHPRQPA